MTIGVLLDLDALQDLLQYSGILPTRSDYQAIQDNLFAVVGPLIVITRLSEPFVLKGLWNQILKTVCCNKKRKVNIKYSSESLSAFLNSSMNVELVAMLLISIENTMSELEIKK